MNRAKTIDDIIDEFDKRFVLYEDPYGNRLITPMIRLSVQPDDIMNWLRSELKARDWALWGVLLKGAK